MERATREVRMICRLHAAQAHDRLGKNRQCTVVPYEYMSVGGVLNGLMMACISSPPVVEASRIVYILSLCGRMY